MGARLDFFMDGFGAIVTGLAGLGMGTFDCSGGLTVVKHQSLTWRFFHSMHGETPGEDPGDACLSRTSGVENSGLARPLRWGSGNIDSGSPIWLDS